MEDMYFRLVNAGKRQMAPGGPLRQVPDDYIEAVQKMLDEQPIK